MNDVGELKITCRKEYKVFLRNRDEEYISANDYDHMDDGLFFWDEEGNCVAWFNTADIIGWAEVRELVIGGKDEAK